MPNVVSELPKMIQSFSLRMYSVFAFERRRAKRKLRALCSKIIAKG